MWVDKMTVRSRDRAENHIPKAHPFLWIQPGGGFIQNEQLRIVEQRLRNAHPLQHAAGKFAHALFRILFQGDRMQHFVNFAFGCMTAHAF